MVIGQDRIKVIENIEKAANKGVFDIPVEEGDDVLTSEESREIISRHLEYKKTFTYKIKRSLARGFANIYGLMMKDNVKIEGTEKLMSFEGGAIITSNHFNPDDSVPVRALVKKLGKQHLNVVIKDSNLAKKGLVGFLMNHADTYPVSEDLHYMGGSFFDTLKSLLLNDEIVLIYPEQEMWFNYRKPRPVKSGAYYFAAKLNVPIISCFIEMRDLKKVKCEEFTDVEYIIHVLDVITPDPTRSQRENVRNMMKMDEALKREAYEKIYGKELVMSFKSSDIAGYRGNCK